LIEHGILTYMCINVYLHPYNNIVMQCTIVVCVILSFV